MGRHLGKSIFLIPLVCALPMEAAFAGCEKDQYFAESDYDHKTPLAIPSPELSQDMRDARAGSHVAQRNLAISYETGYLVGKCEEKAAYWYEKAAQGGDEAARKWIEERGRLEKLAAGPECMGTSCDGNSGNMAGMMSLAAGANGHYFTTISVNGVSVVGMIDTGASTVAMSPAVAASLGLVGGGFSAKKMNTANGVAVAYDKVIPEMKVGRLSVTDVEISVGSGITMTLIGMSALRQLRMSEANGYMTLSK